MYFYIVQRLKTETADDTDTKPRKNRSRKTVFSSSTISFFWLAYGEGDRV